MNLSIIQNKFLTLPIIEPRQLGKKCPFFHNFCNLRIDSAYVFAHYMGPSSALTRLRKLNIDLSLIINTILWLV